MIFNELYLSHSFSMYTKYLLTCKIYSKRKENPFVTTHSTAISDKQPKYYTHAIFNGSYFQLWHKMCLMRKFHFI